jgi:hypothetical protein
MQHIIIAIPIFYNFNINLFTRQLLDILARTLKKADNITAVLNYRQNLAPA